MYHNPDPIVRFMGKANEADVLIDDFKSTALTDTRAQVTTIAKIFFRSWAQN